MSGDQRFGTIAVIGRTNAGKSTLINACVGQKISIVSHKIHTTRNVIVGIFMHDRTQIAMMDTPGLSRTPKPAIKGLLGDLHLPPLVTLLVVDTNCALPDVAHVAQSIQPCPLWVVLNKIDLIPKPGLLDMARHIHTSSDVTDIFMISAKTGDGVQDLQNAMVRCAPPAPHVFAGDMITTSSQREMVNELTREQILTYLHQEIPYGIEVCVDKWDEKSRKVQIWQTIYVPKVSQRQIILANCKIKTIGMAARLGMEDLLGKRVFLSLYVKVGKPPLF